MNWFRFWYDLFKRNGWVVFRVLKFTSLENRGMGQKDQHYPYSGCCLYIHALVSFVVTEIKNHVLDLHRSGQPTPNAVTNNWAKWGPCACSLPLSASAKMAAPIRNVKFSTYFHSTCPTWSRTRVAYFLHVLNLHFYLVWLVKMKPTIQLSLCMTTATPEKQGVCSILCKWDICL